MNAGLEHLSAYAERIDDAPEQSVPDAHIHDAARAMNFISRVEIPVFAEQHDAGNLEVADAQRIDGE